MSWNPQTKRLIIAKINGFTLTCEEVTGIKQKRVSNPVDVVKGDGNSRVHKLHDPAVTVDPVTLRCIVEKNKAGMAEARRMLQEHKKDPSSAKNVLVQSLKDDGTPLDTWTLVKAVFQEVSIPEGSTQQHGEAMGEIIVQPEDIVGGQG
jgi:hypothetical protein